MSLSTPYTHQNRTTERSNSKHRSTTKRTPFFNPNQNFFRPSGNIQRKSEECENAEAIQRQPMEEEEELQMKSMEHEEELQMQPMEEEEEESSVQMSQSESESRMGGEASLTNFLGRSSGGGKPLDSDTNVRMSSAFGYDFSKVKIHDDMAANNASQGIGAQAFTTGKHVYFNKGKYNPGTMEGDRLLAHELTHVVQQSGGLSKSVAANGLSMSEPGDPYEQQADNVANMVTTALHHPPSNTASMSGISRDEDSHTKISLSDAILHRKVRNGVPEIQKDGGTTVAIIGLIVSATSFAVGQSGSNPMTVDPRLERIAEPSEDRERYRRANPMRTKSWSFFDIIWPKWPLENRWMVDLRWEYNGAELTDVHLEQGYEDFTPFDETHAKLIMRDDQASNKKIGFRCQFEWDHAGTGHGVFLCEGWISADGSGRRTAWRRHDY